VLLRDKVVIVSGVGPGLGQELALCAGREGARVVLAARTESFLEVVRAKLESAGAEALAVPTDVTAQESCRRLVQATLTRFGRVDALINSAYTMGRLTPFEEADLDRWQSGVFYADDTPKSSLAVVQRAIRTLQASQTPNCTRAGIKAFAARSLALARR